MLKVFYTEINPVVAGSKISFDVDIPRSAKRLVGLQITVSLNSENWIKATKGNSPMGIEDETGGGPVTPSHIPLFSSGEVRFAWNTYPEVFLAQRCDIPTNYFLETRWIGGLFQNYPYSEDWHHSGTRSVPLRIAVSAGEELIQGIYEDTLNLALGSSEPYRVRFYFWYEEK